MRVDYCLQIIYGYQCYLRWIFSWILYYPPVLTLESNFLKYFRGDFFFINPRETMLLTRNYPNNTLLFSFIFDTFYSSVEKNQLRQFQPFFCFKRLHFFRPFITATIIPFGFVINSAENCKQQICGHKLSVC